MGNGATETATPTTVEVMDERPVIQATEQGLIPLKITTFNEAIQFGDLLVKTGFLPRAIKTGTQAVAIILTGQELGLPPMKSLRMIDVIEGKPALSGQLQLAIFKKAGGKAKILESTDEICRIHFTHPHGDEHDETFTIEEAKRAGLAGQRKDNWNKYPKVMLRWRCVASGLRVVAPDILGGAYTAEELATGFVEQVEAEKAAEQAKGAIDPAEALGAKEKEAPAETAPENGDEPPPEKLDLEITDADMEAAGAQQEKDQQLFK